MGLTITNNEMENAGSVALATGTIAFDTSYPTNGESLIPSNVRLNKIISVQVEPNDGYVFQYDYTNQKLKAFWVDTTVDGAPLVEVTDTTDLVGVTDARFVILGKQ